MPVIFKCECNQYISVPNKYIGQKLQCPNCKTILTVPNSQKETT